MNHIDFNGVRLTPSKVVCIGRNYVEHVKELQNEVPGEPVIFMKPNSSIGSTLYAGKVDEIHYEAEICFLIQAGEISGVGFGLDLTKREVQTQLKAKGLPWERAKAFDHAALFSSFVPCDKEPDDLRIELYIDDKLVQVGEQQQMIFPPQRLLHEIKSFVTLEDGDIIMSGTPAGVGKIESRQRFLGRIYFRKRVLVEEGWIVNGG